MTTTAVPLPRGGGWTAREASVEDTGEVGMEVEVVDMEATEVEDMVEAVAMETMEGEVEEEWDSNVVPCPSSRWNKN